MATDAGCSDRRGGSVTGVTLDAAPPLAVASGAAGAGAGSAAAAGASMMELMFMAEATVVLVEPVAAASGSVFALFAAGGDTGGDEMV